MFFVEEKNLNKIPLLYKKLVIIVFLALLTIPILDWKIKFIPRTVLHGLQNSTARPQYSWKAFKDGHFQRAIEEYALKNHGVWGWSVRGFNEIILALFSQITTDYKISFQYGNEGHFWQPMYLRAFNRYDEPNSKKIGEKLEFYHRLKNRLKKYNIQFHGLISPNKLEMYPELIPDKYKNPLREDKKRGYDLAKNIIHKKDISIFDGYQTLLDYKSKNNFNLRFFETTGSHWNQIGSCVVTRSILSNIYPSTYELPCEDYSFETTREEDLDLLKVSNLLFPDQKIGTSPYIKYRGQPSSSKKLKVLLVGTSFLFGIQEQLMISGVADETLLYFYYKSQRNTLDTNFKPINKKDISIEEILSYDLILVEGNMSNVSSLSYGFMRDLEKKLIKYEKSKKVALPVSK